MHCKETETENENHWIKTNGLITFVECELFQNVNFVTVDKWMEHNVQHLPRWFFSFSLSQSQFNVMENFFLYHLTDKFELDFSNVIASLNPSF